MTGIGTRGECCEEACVNNGCGTEDRGNFISF